MVALSKFSAVVDTTNEDTKVELTFADLRSKGDESADTKAFIVKSVVSGKLLIGSSAATAKAWAAGSNDAIKAGMNAYWTPAADVNGSAVQAFKVVASTGTTASKVAVPVTVKVNPVNDAPTASNRSVTFNEDTTKKFAVADFGFKDADAGNTLKSVTITTLESKGALKLNGVDVKLNQVIKVADIAAGKLTYAPVANGNGTGYTSFGFKVSDGTANSASAYKMTLNVTAVNDAPTASNRSVTFNEDTTKKFAVADFGFKDVDAGNALKSVTITTLESKGALKLNGVDVKLNQVIKVADIAAGKLTYTPVANDNGTGYTSFGFKVSDGTANSASAYKMALNVTAVNDAPTASNRTLTATEDTARALTVSDFGFADVDAGNTLKSVTITTLESKGALKLNGVDVTLNQVIKVADIAAGKLTYTPAANGNGTGYTSFGFKVSDGTANSASAYTATINVAAVNDAPTGSVTIKGTASEDQTLTASHTLADIDGLGTVAYQWYAGGVAIKGATASTFKLGQDQVGQAITVKASYTDKQGTTESKTSSATTKVVNVNDAPTGSVTISGTAKEDQKLTASHTLADADGLGTVAYQWYAGSTAISGATASTFTLGQAQVGQVITVKASYTDKQGTTESKTSSATTKVVNVNDAPTGSVTISGTAAEDQKLTASHTLADADGLGTVAYQWYAGGTAISGATASTFTLGQAQVGQAITVKASYTDLQGTAESKTSAATAAVANVNDAPTGSVTITGTALEGKTLTASNTLADADGMGTVAYKWYADGTEISGATASTFTLGQDQVGKAITVKASYTDLQGNAESVNSAAATSKVVDNGITLTNFDQANLTALLDGDAKTVATAPTLSFDDSGFAFTNNKSGEVDLVVALTSGDDALTVTFADVDLTVATTGTDIVATLPKQTVTATVNINGVEKTITLDNFAVNEQIIGTAGDLATLTLQEASTAWDALIAKAALTPNVEALLATYYSPGATIELTMSDLKNDMGVSFYGEAVDSVTATAVIGVDGVEAHWSFA